jgi:tetratricopeptide (TPR) repeat protein
MNERVVVRLGALFIMLALAGCASRMGGESIYVPMGGEDRTQDAPAPPQTSEPAPEEPQVWRKSEQPETTEPETRTPSYRESGDQLPAAALALIRDADQYLQRGDADGALSRLERAQRIAPRSPEVYLKLAQAYVQKGNLGSAEQFTLKGLSLAGSNSRVQRAGWLLLADIRRARGNVAGAAQAEERAAAL